MHEVRDSQYSTLQGIADAGKGFLYGAAGFSLGSYVFPTGSRLAEKGTPQHLSTPAYLGACGGMISGLALLLVQMTLYKQAVENDYPAWLALPLVTNVASIVYERWRVRERKASLNLEGVVQEEA